MALNDLSASRFVRISEKASKELHSPQAPIVLCPKTEDADRLLPGIAPELNRIGVMMPYTPIHWLLFFEAMGRPEDPDWYKKRMRSSPRYDECKCRRRAARYRQ